jgi:hypothetical protein
VEHLLDVEGLFQVTVVSEDLADSGQMSLELFLKCFMAERWKVLFLLHKFLEKVKVLI